MVTRPPGKAGGVVGFSRLGVKVTASLGVEDDDSEDDLVESVHLVIDGGDILTKM